MKKLFLVNFDFTKIQIFKKFFTTEKKSFTVRSFIQTAITFAPIQIIPRTELSLPHNYNFNESQNKAIRMAISSPFSLIQRPPGTRKTHMIGTIAIQAIRNHPGKEVLICGTTNVSINSLLEIVGDMVQEEGFKVCWPAHQQYVII